MVTLLRNLGLLDDVIRAFPQQIERMQERNNPYDAESQSQLYETYRIGWYEGYIVYFGLSMVAGGGQATKAAKNSDRLADLVDTLDSGGNLARAYRLYSTAKGKATLPARKTGYLLGKSVAAGGRLSARGAGRVLGGARTVGKQVEMRYHLRRAEDTVSGLSDTQQTQFGALLERDGPGTAKLARKLYQDEFERVLDIGRRCRSGVSIASSGGCGDDFNIDEQLVAESDLPESTLRGFSSKLTRLDEEQLVKVDALLAATGDDGIRLVGEFDSDSLNKFLDLDTDHAPGYRARTARYVGAGEVSVAEAEELSENLYELRDVQGVDNIVKQLSALSGTSDKLDSDRFKGPMYEAKVASDLDSGRIEYLGREYGPEGTDGEIDIVLKSGDYIEIKSGDFGSRPQSVFKDMRTKTNALAKYEDVDGSTITWRVFDASNERKLNDLAELWENNIKEQFGSELNIRIVVHETGRVVVE